MPNVTFNGSEHEIEPCRCGSLAVEYDAGMMGCVIWCHNCKAQVVHNGFQDCLEAWNKQMKKDRDCHHGQLARSCPLCERDEEIERLRVRVQQLLDDGQTIRLMMDPENRFPGESNVWIAGWLRSHHRIQPPKKTEKGWE